MQTADLYLAILYKAKRRSLTLDISLAQQQSTLDLHLLSMLHATRRSGRNNQGFVDD